LVSAHAERAAFSSAASSGPDTCESMSSRSSGAVRRREITLHRVAEELVLAGEIREALAQPFGFFAGRVAEQPEGAPTQAAFVGHDASQHGDIRADEHVGVLAAQRVHVVARARLAAALDDAGRLEAPQVAEDVALRAAKLVRQLVHRAWPPRSR
jgi:hypothetical protein